MIESINVVAVIGSSLFLTASAIVWYSPLLFGSLWLKELAVTEEEIEKSKGNTLTNLAIHLGAYVVVVGAIGYLLKLFKQTALPIEHLSLLLATLWAGAVVHQSLWENRSLRYFFINAGFGIYFVIVSVLMLNYWPW